MLIYDTTCRVGRCMLLACAHHGQRPRHQALLLQAAPLPYIVLAQDALHVQLEVIMVVVALLLRSHCHCVLGVVIVLRLLWSCCVVVAIVVM